MNWTAPKVTIDEMVNRGVLPQPLRLSSGCVRWRWAEVEAAIGSLSLSGSNANTEDPFLKGVRNVTSKG